VVDFAAIASHQLSCPETVKAVSSSSLLIEERVVDGVKLLCDVSRGLVRPLIPLVDRRTVFAAFHSLAHPGARATRRLMTARVMWRGLNSDVTAWCRDCQSCQRGKVTQQATAPIQPIPIPRRRFAHIHVDLVGPLPTSPQGYQYLLTVIDRSTRWLEAIPLRDMAATTVADGLVAGWVARFGVPEEITSDRGTQFSSAIWTYLCQRLGIRHSPTTAYHPQANGMIERAHRQLKDALRSRLAGASWPEHLPWVLLGLRTAPKEDTAMSSAELVYGAALCLPGQFLAVPEPPPSVFVEELRTAAPPPPTRLLTYAETAGAVPAGLLRARFVYVRRGGVVPPLAPLYAGPYKVIQPGPKFFLVDIGGKADSVTVDRLKPHLGAASLSPAEPPKRGRPLILQP
jgi:transposase InsO family protein